MKHYLLLMSCTFITTQALGEPIGFWGKTKKAIFNTETRDLLPSDMNIPLETLRLKFEGRLANIDIDRAALLRKYDVYNQGLANQVEAAKARAEFLRTEPTTDGFRRHFGRFWHAPANLKAKVFNRIPFFGKSSQKFQAKLEDLAKKEQKVINEYWKKRKELYSKYRKGLSPMGTIYGQVSHFMQHPLVSRTLLATGISATALIGTAFIVASNYESFTDEQINDPNVISSGVTRFLIKLARRLKLSSYDPNVAPVETAENDKIVEFTAQ